MIPGYQPAYLLFLTENRISRKVKAVLPWVRRSSTLSECCYSAGGTRPSKSGNEDSNSGASPSSGGFPSSFGGAASTGSGFGAAMPSNHDSIQVLLGRAISSQWNSSHENPRRMARSEAPHGWSVPLQTVAGASCSASFSSKSIPTTVFTLPLMEAAMKARANSKASLMPTMPTVVLSSSFPVRTVPLSWFPTSSGI